MQNNIKSNWQKYAKRIFLISVICLLAFTFIYYKIDSTKYTSNTTKDILVQGEDILTEANDIINKTINNFENNDFTDESKKELKADLASLKRNKLYKYSNKHYSSITRKLNNIISETEKCVNNYLEADSNDERIYTSLNSNYYTVQTYSEEYWTCVINFFKENNIPYIVDENTKTVHYQLSENN